MWATTLTLLLRFANTRQIVCSHTLGRTKSCYWIPLLLRFHGIDESLPMTMSLLMLQPTAMPARLSPRDISPIQLSNYTCSCSPSSMSLQRSRNAFPLSHWTTETSIASDLTALTCVSQPRRTLCRQPRVAKGRRRVEKRRDKRKGYMNYSDVSKAEYANTFSLLLLCYRSLHFFFHHILH